MMLRELDSAVGRQATDRLTGKVGRVRGWTNFIGNGVQFLVVWDAPPPRAARRELAAWLPPDALDLAPCGPDETS